MIDFEANLVGMTGGIMPIQRKPREKQLTIGSINIVIHPHTPERYIDLFFAAFRLKRSIQLRGNQHALIGELRFLDPDKPLDGLAGKVYRFTHIDPSAAWFNLEEHKAATEDEVSKIAIPAHLKPNLVMFSFVFYPKYPKAHRLYFESQSGKDRLSVGSMLKLLNGLFSHHSIVKEFGAVDITAIPEREQLDKIFKIPNLKKLIIEITRPNPDDLEDEEARILERLNKQNARRLHQELVAVQNESIKPDKITKALARVASQNGKVIGIGTSTDQRRLEESTVDHPQLEMIRYNPDMQTASDALIAYTRHETKTK